MGLFDEEKTLSDGDRANLNHIYTKLMGMADTIHVQPFDPKIATHLRMAADLADEQGGLNKYYTYPKKVDENEEPDYKFLSQDDTIDSPNSEKSEVKPETKPQIKPETKTGIDDEDIHSWLDGD